MNPSVVQWFGYLPSVWVMLVQLLPQLAEEGLKQTAISLFSSEYPASGLRGILLGRVGPCAFLFLLKLFQFYMTYSWGQESPPAARCSLEGVVCAQHVGGCGFKAPFFLLRRDLNFDLLPLR